MNRSAVAYAFCGVGGIGMFFLWFQWSHHYVWLIENTFKPGLVAGLSGLVSAFARLYSQGKELRKYNTRNIVEITASGGCAAICGSLAVIYAFRIRLLEHQHSQLNPS